MTREKSTELKKHLEEIRQRISEKVLTEMEDFETVPLEHKVALVESLYEKLKQADDLRIQDITRLTSGPRSREIISKLKVKAICQYMETLKLKRPNASDAVLRRQANRELGKALFQLGEQQIDGLIYNDDKYLRQKINEFRAEKLQHKPYYSTHNVIK